MKLRIAGRTIGYDDVGAGPAVALLHPFPLDRRSWKALAAATADLKHAAQRGARRVIAIDARGFGESEQGGPFTIADLADDLAELLDALGAGPAALLGVSMGGYVALAFAQRHAARLRALILVDTRAAADSPETRQAREQAIATIRTEGVGPYLDRSLPRLLAPNAPRAQLAELRALAETRADSLVAGIEALRDRPDRGAELPKIRVPALIISGAQDQVVPPPEMIAMSRALPACRYVNIEEAGHLPILETPSKVAFAVGDFLKDVDGV